MDTRVVWIAFDGCRPEFPQGPTAQFNLFQILQGFIFTRSIAVIEIYENTDRIIQNVRELINGTYSAHSPKLPSNGTNLFLTCRNALREKKQNTDCNSVGALIDWLDTRSADPKLDRKKVGKKFPTNFCFQWLKTYLDSSVKGIFINTFWFGNSSFAERSREREWRGDSYRGRGPLYDPVRGRSCCRSFIGNQKCITKIQFRHCYIIFPNIIVVANKKNHDKKIQVTTAKTFISCWSVIWFNAARSEVLWLPSKPSGKWHHWPSKHPNR